MSEFRPMRRSLPHDSEGISETDYDRISKTRDHHRCIHERCGIRCGEPASFLTGVAATKTKRIGAGVGHESILKSGLCRKHWLEMMGYA